MRDVYYLKLSYTRYPFAICRTSDPTICWDIGRYMEEEMTPLRLNALENVGTLNWNIPQNNLRMKGYYTHQQKGQSVIQIVI